MKKLTYILLSLTMLASLAACGSKSNTPTADTQPAAASSAEATSPEKTNDAAPSTTGEFYDTGNFKVLVPGGWKAFPQHDVFNDDPEVMNPNILQIGKGATSDMDLYSKPAITINYAGRSTSMMAPSRGFYENVLDMDDVTTGNHTWSAFSCESMGQKLYMLFEDQGKIQFQAAVTYETSGGSVSLDDADVQAILASIESTNADDIAAAAEAGQASEPTEQPSGSDVVENDDGEKDMLKQVRGDWNGAFAFRNCVGNFESLAGYEQGAIARFSMSILDELVPFIGIYVEDMPFEDLAVSYYVPWGCYMLSGTWNNVNFEDVPISVTDGTLSMTIPIDAGDFGSLDIVLNLRRLDDTGWTNEDPRLSDSNIQFCMGKTFDELAELIGYSFMDYPSEDNG